MIAALAALGEFLSEHADLIDLVSTALKGGTPKELLMQSIRAAMVEASDAVMRKELG